MGLGLETCGVRLELATHELGLGLDDFRIRRLGLGLRLGERGLGLATMGLDYISVLSPSFQVKQVEILVNNPISFFDVIGHHGMAFWYDDTL